MSIITLKNKKTFECSNNTTIFEAAKQQGILLEHSCLTARCRSCIARVISGETRNLQNELVLTHQEKAAHFVLTCNCVPESDLVLDIEDLGNITIYPKKITPSKIDIIEKLRDDVIKITLRLPPTMPFKFNAGQYVNLIKDGINRSYSIANFSENQLEFFIKNYEGGKMSDYWFNRAKVNDLIRVEGPLGTFFVRESDKKNIVFLGTGTGVAPIKAILDDLENHPEKIKNKTIWVFNGARFKNDLFWQPNYQNIKVNYISTLSREINDFEGFKGYVQDAVLHHQINLQNAQVYACGSSEMINEAKKIFINNNLEEHHFFSDAFVQSN